MDEITEYLAFMPARATAARETPGGAAATTPPLSGGASMQDGESVPAGTVRELLADPKVLAALLRLARG